MVWLPPLRWTPPLSGTVAFDQPPAVMLRVPTSAEVVAFSIVWVEGVGDNSVTVPNLDRAGAIYRQDGRLLAGGTDYQLDEPILLVPGPDSPYQSWDYYRPGDVVYGTDGTASIIYRQWRYET